MTFEGELPASSDCSAALDDFSVGMFICPDKIADCDFESDSTCLWTNEDSDLSWTVERYDSEVNGPSFYGSGGRNWTTFRMFYSFSKMNGIVLYTEFHDVSSREDSYFY